MPHNKGKEMHCTTKPWKRDHCDAKARATSCKKERMKLTN